MAEGRAVFWVHGGIGNKKPVGFIYRGREYIQIFSAKVLEEHYADGKTRLYAFVPHSIYIDSHSQERDRQKKDIGNFEEIPLPSMGRLKGYSFDGNYQYVKFWIFLNLLKVYFEKEYKEYYCDISQGLNVYVDAFKEAFRSFVVFDRLYNFGKEGVRVYMLYSDPILSGVEEPRIYDDIQIKVKVWFDSPLKRKDILQRHKLDSEAERIIKNFCRTYQAIKFNTPPVVLTFGYDPKERIRDVIQKLTYGYLREYDPSYFLPERTTYEYNLPQEPEEKISLFLALALYYNISLALEEAGITQSREFTLQELEKFYRLYEHYGLNINSDMLKRDLRSFKKIDATDSWQALGYYMVDTTFKPKSKDKLKKHKEIKRNFFAHSGMENNCAYVRKDENGQLVFKYREEMFDTINSFVYEGC